MKINTETMVSMTEANQNFSKVARLIDEKCVAIITENNAPRCIVMEFNRLEKEKIAPDEDILTLPKRYIDRNREAYLELAK